MRSFALLSLGCLAVHCLAAPQPVAAQAPATLNENLLDGVIDFHVHSGPDSFTRSVTDLEIARIARSRGMAALVFKNHFTMTGDRAYLAERAVPGLRCFGGIALNRAVGGLNAEAIERMTTFTGQNGKVVWLPTFDAANHVRFFQETRPSVAVVRDGKPVPELNEVLKIIATHNLVLCTGHSSASECLILLRAAKEAGVKRMLVTHAMSDPIGMTVDQMKTAAGLGARIECVWLTNLNGPDSHLASQRHWKKITTADYAAAMKEVGPQYFVISSDLGQFLNPIHTDGLTSFILGLREAGLNDKDIVRMSRENPAELLGIEVQR